jgi:ABC-2 type transport system permease protein
MYIVTIVNMFNPGAMSAMQDFTRTMPQIMSMVGMSGDSTTFLGYLITYLYGFIFLLIPFIATIIVAINLVSTYVESGSMGYLLSSPNNRQTIISTQILVLLTFIIALIVYCTVLTIITSETMFPGKLDITKLLIINLGLLGLHIFLGGIAFLSSTIPNDTKTSIMFGAGIPLVFFIIQMLANMGGKIANLKYLTIFSLFQPHELLSGETNAYIFVVIMFILAIILYTSAFYIFKRKDMSI